jgi:hypothetical protein
MQLTFLNFAVLLSTMAAAFSSANLFLAKVTTFLPLLLSPDSASEKEEVPTAAACNEAIGGVDVLTLRTDTALGRWS